MRNTEWAIPSLHSTPLCAPNAMLLRSDPLESFLDGRNAVLTTDATGCITGCNTAARELLGWKAQGPEGSALTTIFPELPFSSNTPGYNLAYAIFHATNRLWKRRMACLDDGRVMAIDTAFASVLVNNRRFITLGLRPSGPVH